MANNRDSAGGFCTRMVIYANKENFVRTCSSISETLNFIFEKYKQGNLSATNLFTIHLNAIITGCKYFEGKLLPASPNFAY
jgi:hypothetical protein